MLRQLSRWKRRLKYSKVALQFFRYRYLLAFTAFGFLSILVELAVLWSIIPQQWPDTVRTCSAFAIGLLVSFGLNASFNFKVPPRYFVSTFIRFAGVSVVSFMLNMGMVRVFQDEAGMGYAMSRVVCSGVLFLLAYAVHRRLTFRLDRNFGIAVYASPAEQVRRIFLKVGRNCDHIHIDLVDETVKPGAEVDISKIAEARSIWTDVPFAIHLMTRRPDKWLDAVLDDIDWFLFSMGADTQLLPLFAKCHLAGKKVGVVWHQSELLGDLYPLLPHVDFVMVLGIARPGVSGQSISAEALEAIHMLERIRKHYRYELMFDGSVNTRTIRDIPARYVVAASSVLKADQPARVISTLKTGARHERRAA